MSFTPGPWQVLPEEKDKPYIRVRGTVLGARYKIANCLYVAEAGAIEAEEAKANAHLIAAAPELYELLHECIYNATGPQGLFDDIRKILKKARGES